MNGVAWQPRQEKQWICIITQSSLEEVYWERILQKDHEMVLLDDWLVGIIPMPFEQWIAFVGNGFFQKPRLLWCSDLELLTRHAKKAEVFAWYQKQQSLPVYTVASRSIVHQDILKMPIWLHKEMKTLHYEVHSTSPEPTWGTLSNDDLLSLLCNDVVRSKRWLAVEDWWGPLYSFPVLLQAYLRQLKKAKPRGVHDINALLVRSCMLPEEYVSTLLALVVCHGFEDTTLRRQGTSEDRLSQVPLNAMLRPREKVTVSMDPVANYQKRLTEVADVRAWRSML
jgi:hypothetical protein